jgi:hypothetical protein
VQSVQTGSTRNFGENGPGRIGFPCARMALYASTLVGLERVQKGETKCRNDEGLRTGSWSVFEAWLSRTSTSQCWPSKSFSAGACRNSPWYVGPMEVSTWKSSGSSIERKGYHTLVMARNIPCGVFT